MRSPHLTSSWPPLLTPFTQKMSEVLLSRAIQKGIDSAEEGGGIPAEEVMERLRKAMEEPRAEPAVWDKSFDSPLFPED